MDGKVCVAMVLFDQGVMSLISKDKLSHNCGLSAGKEHVSAIGFSKSLWLVEELTHCWNRKQY